MEKSSENKIYRAIGLMSGTAMDGIDAALIETDGYAHIKRIGFHSASHDPILRKKLKNQLNKKSYDIEIEKQFTLAQALVIEELLSENRLSYNDIDIIGFHGQTIHHDPDHGVTVQMGDGQLLANETGVDIIYDFRSHDMKQGGQGAPLLPVYHRALVQNAEINCPVIILNLGGVGNITYIDHDDMIAFDTGPANAMIDDFVSAHTDQKYDEGGKIAAQGTVDRADLQEFLSHSYFEKLYPKSLDRNDFIGFNIYNASVNDGAATLTEFTVQSVAQGIDLCPQKPTAIYVTGGGRHNDYMMQRLGVVTDLSIRSVDTLGWNGDAMEAEGFAYMAVRSILGEPISFPGTTGCTEPVTGGVHVKVKRNAA